MAVGTKVTYADTTTQVRSVVPEFDLLSATEVPFLKLISGGDDMNPSLSSLSAPCEATKYEWMEDEDFSLQTTLGAAVADGSTTSVTIATGDIGKINEVPKDQVRHIGELLCTGGRVKAVKHAVVGTYKEVAIFIDRGRVHDVTQHPEPISEGAAILPLKGAIAPEIINDIRIGVDLGLLGFSQLIIDELPA